MVKPIGVYLHIPFCRKRCAYCDFYTAMCHGQVMNDYILRLKDEIYRWGGALSRPADTVYFGGGTPSTLGAEALTELLAAVKDAFCVSDGAEITLEINPEDATEELLSTVKRAGFNRLSMGVQSAFDQSLKALGRRHSFNDAVNAFNLARECGFDNITVDLMLGLPDGSMEQSLNSAKRLIELSPEHISCYMLILEEKTALFAKRNQLTFPSEDAVGDEYLAIIRLLEEKGYKHYEISNFAKKGKESRHNLKYWHAEEYIGIGPSAYSFIDGKRFHYPADLKGFIRCPKTEGDGEGGDFYEYIMLALRLKEGIREERLKALYGKVFSKFFYEKAAILKENGLIEFNEDRLNLTDKGMLVSNLVICELTEEELYENL
ncbi:MAG: radical SAM family heme chaperone HemW [Clostridia bacterium]|nr:radical SAM family heme chaperone HemW [Clostridia bacterium]